ncbi:hypothetical protein A8B84_18760 [Marinobacter sp. EhC06]|uniref:hypothetical protein n=1 Tax=Marinobacter TaxID=2742 RepID=UPI0007D91E08|nr:MULTISPECIES: hypothetical protein [unclassified Marinobacter]OAN92663.1 hypothetical protein A8B80_00780 [Marinobacter sp. EhN04]OAN95018.1 hypothetical protein A8B84_18760 [Marinobacter sp. EhC06]
MSYEEQALQYVVPASGAEESEPNIPNGFKMTEVGLLPQDWDVKSLSQLGSFKNGINKSSEDFGYGHPFLNLMDVFGVPSFKREIEHLDLVNSSKAERELFTLCSGDVLFVRSSVKPSGVGLTTLIPEDLPYVSA